ncbi:uncharacterized protein LOC128105567 isoform X4 [Peromyscus californicus insignis]|uniref:uncharacterized protein LOC128105567 isoform X4 n=1 Tax=Peromyscus californicus insignis TaxID=564181 RepID=UPI0022A77FA5|nr:uncharacterized protein LOC128105567 isoform X4 [Peromyscus californicus insignis]
MEGFILPTLGFPLSSCAEEIGSWLMCCSLGSAEAGALCTRDTVIKGFCFQTGRSGRPWTLSLKNDLLFQIRSVLLDRVKSAQKIEK